MQLKGKPKDDKAIQEFRRIASTKLEGTLCCFIPLLKVENSKYFYGTEIKNITLKSGKVFVRVGGGFDDF